MPITKADTARFPRTWVFDTVDHNTIGPYTVTTTQANSAVVGVMPLACAVKVVKVAVSWTGLLGAPSFNLVYNTVQALGSAQTYVQGNVAPMENANSGGITTATAGATLVGATPTDLQGQAYGTAGFPNPQLTATSPSFDQTGGLGISTNVAVDAQPLFYNDVVLNTTNFPGSGTTGGQGVIVPTNWDAVYPAGIYPYGQQQYLAGTGPSLYNSDFGASLTLRIVASTGVNTITGLSVSLFWVPVLSAQTAAATATVTTPGQFF